MGRCPNCGSAKIEFRREDAGFRRTKSGSIREHRTVGFCKSCGYTWITDGPEFEEMSQKKQSNKGFRIAIGITVSLFLVGLVFSIRHEFQRDAIAEEYEITEANVGLVTNPSTDYIVQTLKSIEGINDIEVITTDSDTNNYLRDIPGVTSVVLFSYDKIDQAKNTDGTFFEKIKKNGGYIEVFSTIDAATSRDESISSWESGYHMLIGSTVVWTSSKLSLNEHLELETEIRKALLGYK